MNASLNATSEKTNHCVHVIGVGRTGAAYVEALLRTGEVEDMMASQGGHFAALLVDIGEDDMFVPNDYARSMRHRLASREIPESRYHYESVLLQMPDEASFTNDLEAARAPFKASTGQELLSKPTKGFTMPSAGSHTPRAVAKALGAIATHVGDKPLEAAVGRFAEHLKKFSTPSTVIVAFGLAGGTGGGIATDLARALKSQLPENVRIAGLGQMSHSGDGEYHNSLAQTLALESVDSVVHGDASKNPFNAGFFVVLAEHSWQRLTAYTSTGIKEVRQRFKQMVTNRFIADSFFRWATSDNGSHLTRVLSHGDGKITFFDVAKLSHPGVQVLPGEAESRWDSMLQQWIGFTPKFSGVSSSFKTKYAEVHIHAARHMKVDEMDEEMKRVVSAAFLDGQGSSVATFRTEFFDALTAYGNIILPGARSDDLLAYQEAKGSLKNLSASDRAMETA